MAKAVSQLTRIVKNAGPPEEGAKAPSKASWKGYELGSAGQGSSNSTSRCAAESRVPAASNPELLNPSRHGERLAVQALRRCLSGQSATARAQVEGPVLPDDDPDRLGCLRCHRPPQSWKAEALCRLLLLLAGIDQGSWLLSQEAQLEPTEPPFKSFQRRQPNDSLENPHTKLLEARWVELMVHKLKKKDSYIEMRRKIAASLLERAQIHLDLRRRRRRWPGQNAGRDIFPSPAKSSCLHIVCVSRCPELARVVRPLTLARLSQSHHVLVSAQLLTMTLILAYVFQHHGGAIPSTSLNFFGFSHSRPNLWTESPCMHRFLLAVPPAPLSSLSR